MDPKYVRKTVDNLLEDLRRDPRIGGRSGLMARYGRPLGFSVALGLGGIAGCADGSNAEKDAGRDSVPLSADAYGDAAPDSWPLARDTLPPSADIYPVSEVPIMVEAGRDTLPRPVDAYGLSLGRDVPAMPETGRDTVDGVATAIDGPPGSIDGIGLSPVDGTGSVDTRDALYTLDYPVDIYAGPPPDGLGPRDVRDSLPPSGDLYGLQVDTRAPDADKGGD